MHPTREAHCYRAPPPRGGGGQRRVARRLSEAVKALQRSVPLQLQSDISIIKTRFCVTTKVIKTDPKHLGGGRGACPCPACGGGGSRSETEGGFATGSAQAARKYPLRPSGTSPAVRGEDKGLCAPSE